MILLLGSIKNWLCLIVPNLFLKSSVTLEIQEEKNRVPSGHTQKSLTTSVMIF